MQRKMQSFITFTEKMHCIAGEYFIVAPFKRETIVVLENINFSYCQKIVNCIARFKKNNLENT